MNRYPMKTKVDGKVLRNLRLLADESSATVWRWDDDEKSAHVLVAVGQPPERAGATTSWRVGDFVLDEQRGCGCSHPMYAWVPPVDAPQATP